MSWLSITSSEIIGIIVSVFFIYLALLVMIRLNGLRTFSKMSAHDFAVTIAIGSIIAGTALSKEPSVLQGVFAMGTFIVLQFFYSLWRLKRPSAYLENEPLLLMDRETILYENLKKAKLTEDDLIGKLREANVLDFSEVQAAVFEPTGDVSILHGDKSLNKKILQGVRR